MQTCNENSFAAKSLNIGCMGSNQMRSLRNIILFCLATAGGLVQPAQAQFDPRQPLSALISAFQNCGPTQVYQMLAPYLFQLIAQQTGGRGCYPQIASAGPVVGMQVMQSQQFPIGPMFLIRVQHSSGQSADWFIGFNQGTGQVEYLSFQAAGSGSGPSPTIQGGPEPTGGGPSTPSGGGGEGSGDGEGCDLYPAMCG